MGSFFFLIQESWLNLRRQGLMALACVTTAAAALTTFGLVALIAWQLTSIAAAIPKRFEVHAFLRPSLTREQSERLAGQIRKIPSVTRVTYIPRDQAWAEYRAHYPHQEDLVGLTDNPLPDKLEIAAATPKDNLQIAELLRKMPEIDHVNEGRDTLAKLLTIADVARIAGMAIALMLALGTTAVVSNAIRITLFARRRDIRVMQLVGATNSFIRLPFVVEGIVEGALGGGVACAALASLLHFFMTHVLRDAPFVNEFRVGLDLPLFCVSLVAGGALLGMLGSLFSLRKFLHTA